MSTRGINGKGNTESYNLFSDKLEGAQKKIVKLVSAIFYQIFIFHQMIALQKL